MDRSRITSLLPYLLAPLIWSVDRAGKSEAERVFAGTRTLIPNWLELRVVRNDAGLLGAVSGEGIGWLAPLGILAVGMILFWAWRTPHTKVMRHCGFACMIGGALGNLHDRLLHGYVVDYLQVRHLPIFNLADLALFLGLLTVAIDVLRDSPTRTVDG